MRGLTHRLTVLFGTFAAFAGFVYFNPEAVASLATDWAEASVAESTEGVKDDQLARLSSRDEMVLRRLDAKEKVAVELCEGRLSLREAAVWFQRINSSDLPSGWKGPLPFPGATAGERQLRQVLAWVECRCKPGDSRSVMLMERLHREMDLCLACEGVADLEGEEGR
jgi:hypothetical protein